MITLHKKFLYTLAVAFTAFMLLPELVAFAQTASSTVSVSDVFNQAKDTFLTFKDGQILAGIAAAVTTLVSFSKLPFINSFLRSKGLTWIRLVLAVVIAGIASAVAMVAEGKSTGVVVVSSIVTALASPGLADLLMFLKRKMAGQTP